MDNGQKLTVATTSHSFDFLCVFVLIPAAQTLMLTHANNNNNQTFN